MDCNVQTEKCTDCTGSVNLHKLSTPVSPEPRLKLEHGGSQKTLAPHGAAFRKLFVFAIFGLDANGFCVSFSLHFFPTEFTVKCTSDNTTFV